MRKVERNSKVSNAPIAAWRPTLIHRFVRRLNRRCIYSFTSVSRRRKCGVNFPSLREKGCACRGKGASAYRWTDASNGTFTGSLLFFFNPTGFNHSFYFLRGPNVNICLSGNEKVNEKCNDRRIIYRRCNLNNPKSLGYLAIRIAHPSAIARLTFFLLEKYVSETHKLFLGIKMLNKKQHSLYLF